MKNLSDSEISSAIEPYGVLCTEQLCDRIRSYISLLLKWNRAISLTAVTDIGEILRFHIGESLFALSQLPVENCRLADVGSGAGLPGIPLAMARPDLNVSLIESNGKKFAFLSEVIRDLDLKNARALHARMEVLESDRFEVVTARAVGHSQDILKWSSRNLAEEGRIILWLGEREASRLSGTPGWDWTIKEIPASQRRVLLIGSLGTFVSSESRSTVPRGT